MAKDINNEILSNSACIALFRLQSGDDYSILEGAGVMQNNDRDYVSTMPTGRCMMKFAWKFDTNLSKRLVVRKVDGISTDFCSIAVDDMKIIISGERFRAVTSSTVRDKELASRLAGFVETNGRVIEATELVRFMIKNGADRGVVITYMRMLGLRDLDIVRLYETAYGTITNLKV